MLGQELEPVLFEIEGRAVGGGDADCLFGANALAQLTEHMSLGT